MSGMRSGVLEQALSTAAEQTCAGKARARAFGRGALGAFCLPRAVNRDLAPCWTHGRPRLSQRGALCGKGNRE
jgi:hypothetical protein